jgi:uncharacterized coiled-coil protein SlyX
MTIEPFYFSLILAIGVHLVGTIWWAATVNSKMLDIEKRMTAMEVEQRQQDRTLSSMAASVARMEERTVTLLDAVTRVENRIEMVSRPATTAHRGDGSNRA